MSAGAGEIRASIAILDRLVASIASRAVDLPAVERQAALADLLSSVGGGSACVIAIIARGDHAVASQLVDVITLQITTSVANLTPQAEKAIAEGSF